MIPEASICMCSYRRADLLRKTLESFRRQESAPSYEIVLCEDGDDGGWTRGVCEEFGVRYFQRKRRPDQPYSNPAIPWNVALRQARGDVIILQNPECEHVGENVIEKLTAPHRTESNIAVFATVQALQPDGKTFYAWYCHPQHRADPFFFCGSLRRETVFALRGFEEEFGMNGGGYGYDDTLFGFFLRMNGIRFDFRDDIPVNHNWHTTTNCYGLPSNEALFNKKMQQVMAEEIPAISNVGREWGMGDD